MREGGRSSSCVCSAERRKDWRPRQDKGLDVCLQVCQSASGSTVEVASRTSQQRGWTFKVWSRPRRRHLRRVRLQDLDFYALTMPYQDTVLVTVWRQLGDVVAAEYRTRFDASCPILVKPGTVQDSLSPGRIAARVGPLADLYQRKDFDRRMWIYWESFWAPPGDLEKFSFRPTGAAASIRETVDGKVSPEAGNGVWQEPNGRSKAEAFAEIYRKGVWPGLCSRSGPGSDPFHPMVRIAITVLDMVVDLLGATSMLDAACGDAAWIATAFLSRRPQVKYTGVDIVSHVIEENQQRFPSLRFLTADLSGTTLPAADFVFSKETLNHMFLEDAVQALAAFRASGNRYLVTNLHRGAPNHQGATKGHHAHYAPYDYTLPPFNLRKLCPLLTINQEDWTEYAIFAL